MTPNAKETRIRLETVTLYIVFNRCVEFCVQKSSTVSPNEYQRIAYSTIVVSKILSAKVGHLFKKTWKEWTRIKKELIIQGLQQFLIENGVVHDPNK